MKRADVHAAEELIRAREHERQQAAKARCSALLAPSSHLLKGHAETPLLTCLQGCKMQSFSSFWRRVLPSLNWTIHTGLLRAFEIREVNAVLTRRCHFIILANTHAHPAVTADAQGSTLDGLVSGIVGVPTHAARHPMCRMAELNRKRELNAAAELKRAEIILARRYAHQAMLAKFLRTAAQPQLLWAPAKHCADTILLEEQRQLELAVWMVRTAGITFLQTQEQQHLPSITHVMVTSQHR